MPATFPATSPTPSFFETPIFNTQIITYNNKNQQRIQRNSVEQWKFQAWWKVLSLANKEAIQQFFLARKGRFESFTLIHPQPSQIIGTDALNYTCKLTHTAASGNRPTTGGSYTTYWNQTGNKGITWVSGYKYKYDFLVTFMEDMANFEYWQYMLWRLNTIEFLEVAA